MPRMDSIETPEMLNSMESNSSRFSFFPAIFASPFAPVLSALFLTRVKDRLSKRASASAFIESVLGILSPRSMPEVLWVHTSGIIAAMANLSPWRNRAFEFFENKSMRQSLPHLAILSPFDLAIGELCAGIIRLPCVVPASGLKIDFYSQEDSLPWLK